MMNFRIGFGYDVHRFSENRKLILGGVEIPYSKGLLGHSDADVLIHAICDALLGAAGLRDIGYHFPDSDPAFKNADSKRLLAQVVGLINNDGWLPGNIDATIVLEAPRISPHIPAMRTLLSEILQTDVSCVSVKATTSEGIGFTGRGEGIAAYASALIVKKIVPDKE